ncbi:MAG: TlpA family protein disulfide reductase [Lachnospiraceae bacterium]|nr:TlpA family protein disulfide reductase [Lachnospiraceae bacterium]
MKKRISALLLAGVLVLSTGCSGNVGAVPAAGEASVAESQATADELPEAPAPENADGEETEAAADEEAEPGDNMEECSGGLRFQYPDAFVNATGIIHCSSYEMDDEPGVFVTYFAYTGASEDWLNEHIYIDDPTPEDEEKYAKAAADFTYVISIDKNRGLDALAEIVKKSETDNEFNEKDYTEIAKAEDCTFFRYTKLDKSGSENLEGEFRQEFDTLYGMIDDLLKNAEYFKPAEPFADLIGKKIEFTTTDIDGNPVTSDEIFSKNEVTMVNVWATWCYWCVDELPELNKINNRLTEKNCAVVGLVGDGIDENTIAEAKKLLKENGDEYLNILPWENALTDDFPMTEGWPTTFFVDKEGRIAARPVVGANIKKYEKVVDEILAGGESESEPEENEEGKALKNDVKLYRIYVSDTEGNLIEGAMIQLCDDSTCRMESTDQSGLAVFNVDQSEYTVHVLKQPEGYKKDNQEYKFPAEYSDLHIILEEE